MRISLTKAVDLLLKGDVVALPTETVYGLAAKMTEITAVENIFKLKGRPSSNPLIVHLSSVEQAAEMTLVFPPQFEELAEVFWPGPLTLIVPVLTDRVPDIVRSGLPTVGFRIPAHPLTLEVISQSGPLVMPSANISGLPSGTRPEHVENDFGLDFPILDGGSCLRGIESTILFYDLDRWVIARLGATAPEEFKKVLGYVPEKFHTTSATPLCPGHHFRHYSPRAKLILSSEKSLEEFDVVLGFEGRKYPSAGTVVKMGSLSNPVAVAERLYDALRQLDLIQAQLVGVDMDFPREGLWETIAERLERASSR